jgi:acetyl-CoA C-acetyltransferase|tara:strand:- start:1180 stop:2340 length:1161 start_codon:yes stop_codon:yes gene_type:complete
MSKKVAVIGVGITKFGELWNESFRTLFVKSGTQAIQDAGISSKDIDALFGGNMSGGQFIKQEHLASLAMDHTALLPKPAMRVEAACASGGMAVSAAYMGIKSGMYDVVAAGGVEKMTDVLTNRTTGALSTAADQEWESFQGATFPGLYAMIARRHMHEYGTTEEQMAEVAVKNHYNGSKNPNAQYQREITVDQVMNSAKIADPIKLLDCSPISDGAAVVILAGEETAKLVCDDPIWLVGTGQATGSIALHNRKDICTLNATVEAAKRAYGMAELRPKDISCAEVHDCFTIAELCAIEDLGFCDKGKSGQFVQDGHTRVTGSIPINTSGGLKAKGHPVGATGVAQVVEAVLQLRGKAGARQVTDPEYVLTHNVGGSGGTASVHIFGR